LIDLPPAKLSPLTRAAVQPRKDETVNAEQEIERLLDEHGAVLVRQKNHLVYRLPNGHNFVKAKTSSDPDRAAKNNLSDLRRALGIVRQAEVKGEPVMPTTEASAIAAEAYDAPVPEPPKEGALKERIETAVAATEAEQEVLLAAAQRMERRAQMLRALLPFSDDPMTEDVLLALLPIVEPLPVPEPEPQRAPEPPQQITERVQVTRQLVHAATQTFEDTFTVNDVLELMTNGAVIDREERTRVRSSIAQAMISLHERGELIRVAEHFGRKQATWRKVPPNGAGIGTRG